MNLKGILKAIRLNESSISMILGALVIIIVGVLVVNYFKDKKAGGLIPGLSSDNKIEVGVSKGQTHQVAKDESLWIIAQKYYGSGYNWVDIATANKLTDASKIDVGQQLVIPNVAVRNPEQGLEVVAQKAGTDPITGVTYTVVKGDNLWNIAVRAYGDGYKWVNLAKENKLANPDLIHPGNILVLPR